MFEVLVWYIPVLHVQVHLTNGAKKQPKNTWLFFVWRVEIGVLLVYDIYWAVWLHSPAGLESWLSFLDFNHFLWANDPPPHNSIEKERERIPSREEVKKLFEQFLSGAEYATRREMEDEKGLYLWEIVVSGEDGDTEYLYMRKGRYSEGGQASETAIHVTFFDEDGVPVGGHAAAKYRNGEWAMIA